MRPLYPTIPGHPRSELSSLLWDLGAAYQNQSEHAKASDRFKEAFDIHESTDPELRDDDDNNVELLVILAHNYTYSNQTELAKKSLLEAERRFDLVNVEGSGQPFLQKYPLAAQLQSTWAQTDGIPGFVWPSPSELRKMPVG